MSDLELTISLSERVTIKIIIHYTTHVLWMRRFLLSKEHISGTWSTLKTLFFRYLHKTFTLASSFAQPDVVIYLGDLLDEGSVALDSDYEEYFRRFNHVFQLDPHVKVSGTNNYRPHT